MKQVLGQLLICALLIGLAGGLVGCVKTPEGKVSLDPNVAADIDAGAEAAISIGTILSAFWPALIPVVTAAGAGVGVWKKVKPKLVAEQDRADMYYHVTEAAVKAIEELKAKNPDEWEDIKAKYFTDVIGKDAENVIRAIRNLPLRD